MYPPSSGNTTPPAALTPGITTLIAALSAIVLGWLGPLAYPFRLLTTIVHELSHGLVTLLTGGVFLRFVVFPDGAGMAYTAGGIRWLIIPAGYVGAALFGAALITLGRSHQRSRVALGVLGAALALLTLRYGLPTVFSAQFLSGLLTVGTGVGLGALLVTIFHTALLDATGILAATAVALGGFLLLPAKQRQAKKALRERVAVLREQLRQSIERQFEREVDRSLSQVRERNMPFTRFVRAQRGQLGDLQQVFADIDAGLGRLRKEIG